MNKASVHRFLYDHSFQFFKLNIYSSVIDGSDYNCTFSYLGNSMCFPERLCNFRFLPAMREGHSFSASFPGLGGIAHFSFESLV